MPPEIFTGEENYSTVHQVSLFHYKWSLFCHFVTRPIILIQNFLKS